MKFFGGRYIYLIITKKKLSQKKLDLMKQGKAHLRSNPMKKNQVIEAYSPKVISLEEPKPFENPNIT